MTAEKPRGWLESLIWGRQDEQLRAAGFEVERLGVFARKYRHPAVRIAAPAVAETVCVNPQLVNEQPTTPALIFQP